MDLQKAFDKVPHKRLLQKAESYGISRIVLKWLEGFLIGRKQQVTVNKATSAEEDVISGVPQGSVLGPILFVLYVNDLPDYITSCIGIFADDTKIFRKIEDVGDCQRLQNNLSHLEAWATDWQMRFHPQKSEVLRIGNNNPEYSYCMFPEGSKVQLNVVDSVKDLGVFIDNQLSFDKHCHEANTGWILMIHPLD